MLIRDAELHDGMHADVRLAGGRIAALARRLLPLDDEPVIDAAGRALSVGLHDHHMHLLAYAAALESFPCGTPALGCVTGLAEILRIRARQENPAAPGWIRGIGYHESVAGDIDRDWLDAIVPHVPVRIQHRSGRLWILNTRALRTLGIAENERTSPLERVCGRLTGRLYDGDDWLRSRLAPTLPALGRASEALARMGVTGVTDAGPRNGCKEFEHFVGERLSGRLGQEVLLMGNAELDGCADREGVRRGPTKLYLRDAELPDFDDFCTAIAKSHRAARAVAIHCVTVAELVFATTALRHCGVAGGDRIEHASVAPPDTLQLLLGLELAVVTQPNFVFERGDAYLCDVDAIDLPWLYRGKAFDEAGIPLGAGTDAPYGDANPWAAMAAAVRRRTCSGKPLGPDENLSPARALALFTTAADSPGGAPRRIEAGAPADLCLLDRGWEAAFADLAAVRVELTLKDGRPIWQR
ncbi:amidohydrolase family protein [Aromatoleum diolicum]|uniref:Amidohydrolase family protein n=1 Tax=Aromatoleum diolicum TaxID=75796 RepID=A0ABX1QGJ0_9RHOO|nr:amidohydrolase family protein [Aromatoleum diolicum]NMG76472.1 amidohydrolase family protein [Aromatoleum diolicum]